jgi:hypothetical protein
VSASPPTIPRRSPARTKVLAVATFLMLSAKNLLAQGCAQCRDNAAATPPQTQAAYRHAIILLILVAGTIFLSTLYLLKKHDRK